MTIHLESKQMIYFDTAEKAKGQILSGKATQTTLTEFFQLNQLNSSGGLNRKACTLLSDEIPCYFWWDASQKAWKARKTVAPAVGRIYSVSYLSGENFFLRVLLLHRKGSISFEDLKLVEGQQVEIYREACILLGLLIDDLLYHETLKEANLLKSGFQLSQLFAIMLVQTPPSNLTKLFRNHYMAFTDNAS